IRKNTIRDISIFIGFSEKVLPLALACPNNAPLGSIPVGHRTFYYSLVQTISGIRRIYFTPIPGVNDGAKTQPFEPYGGICTTIPIWLHISHYVQGIQVVDSNGIGYGPTISVCQNWLIVIFGIC